MAVHARYVLDFNKRSRPSNEDVCGPVSNSPFGSRGGWAISPTNYTLQLTVGGIATAPAVVDGEVEPRGLLSLTATFDHDVVDGAPAARFVPRFGELVDGAHGLETFEDGSP